jgi:Protein of unknown function (DUF2911)
MKRLMFLFPLVIVAASVVSLSAQQSRPPSPPGTATTVVGGQWTKNAQGNPTYEGGKWIEVTYSRPMLRQRDNIFGTGAEYGKFVNAGAPVWRVGANQTTRFKTEVPLVFDGKTLPVGEYSMFVDLKEGAWTLIFSNWPAQKEFNADDKTALFGADGYTPDRDVLRARMEVTLNPSMRIDQLTIFFIDVTQNSGKLAIAWDTTTATVPFKVGR